MDSKSVRRVVVGHDEQGKAVALFDGPATPRARSAGGNAVLNLWVTSEFPVDMTGAADKAETKVGVPPPTHGTIFRIWISRQRQSPLRSRKRTTKKR